MRIIGGTHKGRRYSVPSAFNSRPTTDMARESLMNVLLNKFYFEESAAIDLFAGTGGVSFEFASRGMKSILSVENNFKVFQYLNRQKHDFEFEQMKILKKDAFKFLMGSVSKADIIFADPPFDLKGIEMLPNLIIENNWLNKDGCFILEHSRNHNFDQHPLFSNIKQYGAVHFSFFFAK